MKEGSKVALICLILLAVSAIAVYFVNFSAGFNFYKAELKIDGSKVYEAIYFSPDKDYHTLYRNFETPLVSQLSSGDGIKINNVECSAGTPYADLDGNCLYFGGNENTGCMAFMENNEYGCGFGDTIGFYKGNEYKISAEYDLSASSIFRINGKDYIKFVAYSKNMHKYLQKDKNLFISGDFVSSKFYLPSQYVIIYLPYSGSLEGKNIVYKDNFEFDSINYLWIFILVILPASFFFFIWHIFGKERSYENVPESLSFYPKERKCWEVAAFFSPPFSKIDNKFFASMLLNFYHKKIIDIKMEKKTFYQKAWIKINKYDSSKLDEIEKEFISIFEYIKENFDKSGRDGEYIDFESAASSLKSEIREKITGLNEHLGKIGKHYIENTGNKLLGLFISGICIASFFMLISKNYRPMIIPAAWLATLIPLSIFTNKSALLTRYKSDFYKEYLHWQAFKNYISYAPTIKGGEYKAVILWDQYMVYALALGVSKKAINELKDKGMISEKEYNAAIGFHSFSYSFLSSQGISPAPRGGGFGGAGGGGVGGGGGGGR